MAGQSSRIVYPVKDLAQAKALYSKLSGVEPYMDAAYSVAFSVEGQDIGLDPNGHSQGMRGPVGYWHVDDIKESLRRLLDAGASPAGDQGCRRGKLIVSVNDAVGNIIGLVQPA